MAYSLMILGHRCNILIMTFSNLLPFITFFISTLAMASPAYFDDARRAASEGRYQNVVEVLSLAIADQSFDPDNLADAYSNRGIAYSLLKDHSAALADLNRAIEVNPEHLQALNHLGVFAQHVEKNDVAAASWYGKSAQLGHAASQVKLGNLYREGRGVAMNPAMAVTLYTSAQKQGYSDAYVPLAEMYLKGWGTEVNYQRALELLHLGVAEGSITGRYFLGRVYENGWGAEQDLQQAIIHYRQVAFQGFAPAQRALGDLYRKGRGYQKDLIEAAKWYQLATEQGDPLAANQLAWLLATCPVKELCNGAVAVEYASIATTANPSASNLDTLAAAHARVGEFDEAVTIIHQISLDHSLSERVRTRYSSRLELYQNGIPYQL